MFIELNAPAVVAVVALPLKAPLKVVAVTTPVFPKVITAEPPLLAEYILTPEENLKDK